MLDLKIDCLRLDFDNAAGHEHRIAPIAQRSVAIFAERLGERIAAGEQLNATRVAELDAREVKVDLTETGGEQLAQSIAEAWLSALGLKLKT